MNLEQPQQNNKTEQSGQESHTGLSALVNKYQEKSQAENKNTLDLEQPLSPEQSAKMAQEFVANKDDEARTIGRFNFLKAVGNKDQLRKEDAGALFDSNYQSEHMYIAGSSNVKFERVLRNPTDYLEAYDKSLRDCEMEIEKRKEEERMDPATFAQTHADRRILYEHDTERDPRGTRGIYRKIYRVKDFTPEDALTIYKRSSQGMWKDIYEDQKKNILLGLEGFSRTALEEGDIETALEGYKRLGRLNDPELQSSLEKTLETLNKSKDPNDQKKFKDILEKLKSLTS